MTFDNLRHAQYDPFGVQIDDPHSILRDLPGWTPEVTYIDATLQSGAPIDTPRNILFGAGGVSPGALVSMDALGVTTLTKAGPYAAKNRFRVGRTGSTGISHIFLWVELSVDGGTSWAPLGGAAAFTLDAAADSQIFFDFAQFNLPGGSQLRQRFARSSTGSNFGDLVPLVPSATLQALGVPTAPSAQLTVYKLIGYPYV